MDENYDSSVTRVEPDSPGGVPIIEPGPSDFFSYSCAIRIDAPPERVFAVVGNLENSVAWTRGQPVRTIAKTTEGPINVGTRYRSSEKITMSFGGDTEIVKYRPNELIVWKSKPVGERVPYHRWAFRLEPANGGTRLTHEVRAARAGGIMRLVQGLGYLFTHPRTAVPANMERTLTAIKQMVEDQPTL